MNGSRKTGFLMSDVAATTSPEAREVAKAQDYSLNWLEGAGPEIICGLTGDTSH
jgi:hypothetical protein